MVGLTLGDLRGLHPTRNTSADLYPLFNSKMFGQRDIMLPNEIAIVDEVPISIRLWVLAEYLRQHDFTKYMDVTRDIHWEVVHLWRPPKIFMKYLESRALDRIILYDAQNTNIDKIYYSNNVNRYAEDEAIRASLSTGSSAASAASAAIAWSKCRTVADMVGGGMLRLGGPYINGYMMAFADAAWKSML